MQCPECHSLNDTLNGSCPACGLLLLNLKPKRRAEDLATQKRRKVDQASATCPYCQGAIATDAVRCMHCSEIVDDDYYRTRAQRIRSRVNYASWVAYLFGLGALLVFRPVGIVSIGAGLLMSIIYYAIPVEPPATKRNPHRLPLGRRLARQFKLERVSIPIPAFRKKRLVFIGTPLIAALIGYSANVFLLQEPMNDVLRQNAAFQGMNVSAHYEYWVVPGVVVYDLRALSFRQTPIDVHTAFLEFAKRMREAKVKRVELSYRGTTKFTIDGMAFRRLGDEYAKRNFDYVLYTFPRLFHSVGPEKPASTADSERDALLQFHRRWYGEDQLTRSVANGM
jgi:predicted nucleic acid-binding Zn ribbon protein